jgi:hypothetical protein
MGVNYFNVFFSIKRGIYEDHRIASVLSKTSIGYVLKSTQCRQSACYVSGNESYDKNEREHDSL